MVAEYLLVSVSEVSGPRFCSESWIDQAGCSMIVTIYISELAPPAIRGRLVGLYELGWQVSVYRIEIIHLQTSVPFLHSDHTDRLSPDWRACGILDQLRSQ